MNLIIPSSTDGGPEPRFRANLAVRMHFFEKSTHSPEGEYVPSMVVSGTPDVWYMNDILRLGPARESVIRDLLERDSPALRDIDDDDEFNRVFRRVVAAIQPSRYEVTFPVADMDERIGRIERAAPFDRFSRNLLLIEAQAPGALAAMQVDFCIREEMPGVRLM